MKKPPSKGGTPPDPRGVGEEGQQKSSGGLDMSKGADGWAIGLMQAKDNKEGLAAVVKELQGLRDDLKEKTDKQTKDIEKQTKEQTKEIVEETKKTSDINAQLGMKTVEKESETKKELKKMFEKLGEKFSSGWMGLKDWMIQKRDNIWDGMKKVWDKIKTYFMWFLGIMTAFALGKNLSVGDIKKLWENTKKFLTNMKELFFKMIEFMTPFVDWFKKYTLPATFNFFMDTMDDLKKLMDNLTKDFEGWQEGDFFAKMWSITKSIESIGEFALDFFKNMANWVATAIFGYDGTLTKDINKVFTSWFGPTLTEGFTSFLNTIVGMFLISKIFGMSTKSFVTKVGALLRGSIMLLIGAVRLALSPIGIAVGLTALAWHYRHEVTRGVDETLQLMAHTFLSYTDSIHNWIMDKYPKGAEFLGWKRKAPRGAFNYDEGNQKMIQEAEEKAINLEKRVKDLKLWKQMSGPGGNQFEGKKLGKGKLFDPDEDQSTLNKAEKDLQKAKKNLEILKKNVAFVSKTDQPKNGEDFLDIKAALGESTRKVANVLGEGSIGKALKDDFKTVVGDDIFRGIKNTMGYEQFRTFSYDDKRQDGSIGKSIGYGFNLDKDGAADQLKFVGITDRTLKELYDGKRGISETEGRALMRLEWPFFQAMAKKWIGEDNWRGLTGSAKVALTDMAYNMGSSFYTQGNWPGLKKAILDGNDSGPGYNLNMGVLWNTKGDGPSDYFMDVGKRAVENLTLLQGAYSKQRGMNIAPVLPDYQFAGKQGGNVYMNNNGSQDSYSFSTSDVKIDSGIKSADNNEFKGLSPQQR